MAQRIVTAISGFALLALNACTITIQSGPSSPATQAYAPAAVAPRYVAVATPPAPARAPAAPIVVQRPAPRPLTSTPGAGPCAPVAGSSAPVAGPSAPVAGPSAPAARPSPSRPPMASKIGSRESERRPVLTSVPMTHTQTRPPVSATVQTPTTASPAQALAPSAAASPRTLVPKPGDPRVRNWL
ncbi:MAG TPA: hypothetical protein VFK05_15955 [Polyangiaceae bacterium]|nr:hypothetical protein [Polyangiaceae bacterium]